MLVAAAPSPSSAAWISRRPSSTAAAADISNALGLTCCGVQRHLKASAKCKLSFKLSITSAEVLRMGHEAGLGPAVRLQKRTALSVRSKAFDEDVSGDVVTKESNPTTTGTVLPAVGIACLGAILFGYHLGAKARNFEMMVIGRILVGFGIGVSSSVVPLYISEMDQNGSDSTDVRTSEMLDISTRSYYDSVSPTDIRGTLGTLNQLFISVGILVAIIAGLPLGGSPSWWRNMFGIATVPAILLALGMAYCPESPRWLYKQGRTSDAEIAVRKLWGKVKVDSSMADLKAGNVELVKGDNLDACWGELFGKRYRKVVTVGMAMFLFQQFAGINAVVYFSTQVFRSAGITSDVAASALVGAANVIGTTVASLMMDKSGRRTLLMGSYAGMSLAMLVLSLALSWSALLPHSGTLSVFGTVAYVLAFSLGVGPVPALLLPKIFGARIRAKAVSLSLGVHWLRTLASILVTIYFGFLWVSELYNTHRYICNFIIGLMFLCVVQRFGVSIVYLFFADVCAGAVLFVNGNVVETKGRSLEDIELELCPSI